MPDVDTRFLTPGADARFPSPGADARFPSPGTDTRFPFSGTDTRFADTLVGLFADGTAGFFLDFTALDAIYQDNIGATPLTAPGQWLKLATDVSRGLALGPELVTNGDFAAGAAGWTVAGAWAIASGNATATATSTSLYGGGVAPVSGQLYRIDFDVVSYTSGNLAVTVGGNYTGNAYLTASDMSVGRKTVYVLSGVTTARGVEFYGGTITAVIDNISVRAINSIPLAQANTGLSPKWGRAPKVKWNLLTWTEDFTNAAWAKANGSVSGTRFTPNNTAAVQHRLDQVSAIPAGPQVLWAELKYAGYQWASLRIGADGAAFDILNGVVGGIVSGATATITPLINGNYLCAFFAPSAVANATTRINVEPTDTIGGSFAGDGIKGLDVIRTQRETGTTLKPYQKVTSAFDVTEAGLPSYGYIRPDLFDDYLTVTTPAAQTGDVLVFGRSGSWIESNVTYGSGSTWSIGVNTVTGLPPGLLAAIGDIVGIIAIGRTLTATERNMALAYHKARGAAGWLVAGAEMLTNGDFAAGMTGITNTSTGTGSATVSGGQASLTGVDVSNRGSLYFTTPISGATVGGAYLISWEVVSGTAASQVAVGSAATVFDNFGPTTVGIKRGVFIAGATTITTGFNVYGAGTVVFDNFSIKPLTVAT